MPFLKLISGPSPQKLEHKGDDLCIAQRWGEAKQLYERALHKLEKSGFSEDDSTRLLTKIARTRESLARVHLGNARRYLDGGHYTEAHELMILALEVAGDGPLRSELEQALEQLETQMEADAREASREIRYDLDALEDGAYEAENHPFAADEEFFALCHTLPDEVRAAYLEYGTHFQIGYLALNQGDFTTAAEHLAAAMAEHPHHDSYIPLELAGAYINLNRTEEARKLLEIFLGHHPEALPAYQLLCEIYWEQNDTEAAETLLAGIPQELGESLAVVFLRGETYLQAARYTAARDLYEEVLDRYGWHDTVARELARVLEAMDQPERACDLYQEIMGNCRSCGARIDPIIIHRYAELRFAMGVRTIELLETYLSLAREIPDRRALYFGRVSEIYNVQGHTEEARRFQAFSRQAESEHTNVN
jgi:tetratricopeptide (TPR) repeat protein